MRFSEQINPVSITDEQIRDGVERLQHADRLAGLRWEAAVTAPRGGYRRHGFEPTVEEDRARETAWQVGDGGTHETGALPFRLRIRPGVALEVGGHADRNPMRGLCPTHHIELSALGQCDWC